MSGKALPCPLPRCSTQELQIVQVLHPCQAPQAVSQDACLAPKLSLWHNSSLVSPVRPASAVARDLAASGPSGKWHASPVSGASRRPVCYGWHPAVGEQ